MASAVASSFAVGFSRAAARPGADVPAAATGPPTSAAV